MIEYEQLTIQSYPSQLHVYVCIKEERPIIVFGIIKSPVNPEETSNTSAVFESTDWRTTLKTYVVIGHRPSELIGKLTHGTITNARRIQLAIGRNELQHGRQELARRSNSHGSWWCSRYDYPTAVYFHQRSDKFFGLGVFCVSLFLCWQ